MDISYLMDILNNNLIEVNFFSDMWEGVKDTAASAASVSAIVFSLPILIAIASILFIIIMFLLSSFFSYFLYYALRKTVKFINPFKKKKQTNKQKQRFR